MIRIEPKYIYRLYYMHDINHVNDIEKINLLHDILKPSKHGKITNYNYPFILNGFINTWRFKVEV